MKNAARALMLASVSAFVGATQAHAIDSAPGDYTWLGVDRNALAFYTQYSSAGSLTLGTVGAVPNSRVDALLEVIRGARSFEIADQKFAAQFYLSFGGFTSATIGGIDQRKTDGLGDLTGGLTWYALASREPTGTTLGLSVFVTAPTGSFDIANVSLGSGAWTVTPQIGLIQGLGNGFFMDVIADVSASPDFTANGVNVSRSTSGQFQAYLRYKPTLASSVSFGYSGTFGGNYYMNGAYTGQKFRDDQLRVFAATFVSEQIQLQGMLATSINTDDGFQNSIIAQLRVLALF